VLVKLYLNVVLCKIPRMVTIGEDEFIQFFRLVAME